MLLLDLTNIDMATAKEYIRDFIAALCYFHALDKKQEYIIHNNNCEYRLIFPCMTFATPDEFIRLPENFEELLLPLLYNQVFSIELN